MLQRDKQTYRKANNKRYQKHTLLAKEVIVMVDDQVNEEKNNQMGKNLKALN